MKKAEKEAETEARNKLEHEVRVKIKMAEIENKPADAKRWQRRLDKWIKGGRRI